MSTKSISHNAPRRFRCLTIVFWMLVLFSGSSDAYGQHSRQGYIINLKGDTVNGIIEMRHKTNSPTFFLFKDKVGEQYKKISIGMCLGFGMRTPDEFYESFTGNVSKGEVRFEHLSVIPDTTTKRVSAYIKRVVTGNKVSLYRYTDDLKSRFLFRSANQPFNELIFRIFLVGTHDAVSETYKLQLDSLQTLFAPFDETLRKKITNAEYEEKDMTMVFEMLNGIIRKKE